MYFLTFCRESIHSVRGKLSLAHNKTVQEGGKNLPRLRLNQVQLRPFLSSPDA